MDSLSSIFDIDFVKDNLEPEIIDLSNGQELFNEGEANDYVYYVASGSVKVSRQKWVIGITYTSEFVGITSCLCESDNYTFSSVANEKSSVLRIKKDVFKDTLLKNPTFTKFIIQILCERIRLTDLKTSNFLDLPAEQRVIIELLNNSKEKNQNLKSALTIKDLSELTGVSKRSVKALLDNFSNRNLIKLEGKQSILLLDKKELESMLETQ